MSLKKNKFFKGNDMCTQKPKTLKNTIKSKLHIILLLLFVTVFCFQPIDTYAQQVWKTGSTVTIYMIVSGATNQTVTFVPKTNSTQTDSDKFESQTRNLTHTVSRPNPGNTTKPYISAMTSNNNTKSNSNIGHGNSAKYIYGRFNVSFGGLAGYYLADWKKVSVDSGNGTSIVTTTKANPNGGTLLGFYNNAYFDYNIKNGGITGYGAKQNKKASGCYIAYYYLPYNYTITAYSNGGSWNGTTSTSGTVTYNTGYWIPSSPSRTGYTFAGWYTAASGGTQVTSSTTYLTAGNSSIYAHWTANKYTLTLDARGGKVNGKNTDTKTVTYDSAYGDMPTPERYGYAFDGWYTAVDSSDTAVESGTPVKTTDTYKTAGNQTLYAHWTLTKKITYDSNGGTGDTVDFDVRVNVPTTYYNGATFTRKDTNIGTSYTLVGWSTEQFTTKVMFKPGQSFTPTTDRYLYAVWRKTGTGFIQLPRYCGDMFTNDVVLKGGNGTVYNSDYIDGRRAHIDGTDPRGTGEPNAYFSLRQD